MTNPIIDENPIIKLLIDAGFSTGWAISGDNLILWEHDAEPPAPLTRPVLNNKLIKP
jgi:hypothetical protein